MEREKKGLFGRLLDFWKEKISMGQVDGIGFWNDTEIVENHFAEMGAAASLSQEETKKAFWEETSENVMEVKQEERGISAEDKRIFFVPEEEKQEESSIRQVEEFSSNKVEKRVSKMFTAEVFRNGGREGEVVEEKGLGKTFLWEMPEGEKVVRNIIPVAEEAKQEDQFAVEEVQEIRAEEMPKGEETTVEPTIDIEKLMRQMTKKLWEERESCGRRLR